MAKKKTSLFLKQDYQVIYAIILIILIPLTIILNTIWSVKSFKKNIDIGLQRQALLIGQLFNASVFENIEDVDYLQGKLDLMAQANTELRTFDILVEDEKNFKVIVSLNKDFIGRTVDDLNYLIAWNREEAVATLVSDIGPEVGGDSERFWEIAMPLTGTDGETQGLLSLRMSLAVMDDLARDTLTKSYIILSITILIVILLLALNTRLFEHAILFRKLKEVDKMKDEFISIASHELRTPITTIKGFLSMSLEGDYGELNESSKKGFKIMEASVNRLGHLVEDLLNVSRIEQNRLIVKKEPVDLKEVLDSLILEFELRIKKKGLTLKLSADKDLPQIWADEDKFKQVIINLLGNSIKYTKQGEIELIAKKTDDKFITITIKDSGIGMDASEREKLFEKFYRVQGEETRGIIGTGLGFWITKQLVELMDGTIAVDSIKHVGSQFYFTIPIYNKEIHKIEGKPQTEKRNKKTA